MVWTTSGPKLLTFVCWNSGCNVKSNVVLVLKQVPSYKQVLHPCGGDGGGAHGSVVRLRHYVTRRGVADSIPVEVIGVFQFT
jgi:hypothetical protein